jgi:phytoene dehydrogenase-like protein
MRYHPVTVKRHVFVVGGGLAGLAASVYLARGGRNVTLFEKRSFLGGRAITNLRHGFRFNLGAHALYRTGPAARVYRELGIPALGGRVKREGLALLNGSTHKLPISITALLTTSLLSFAAKAEMARLWIRIARLDTAPLRSMTVRQWLDANVSDARLRELLEALIRLASYADHADTQSAAIGLTQLKLALKGSIYLHEGWQKLVDSLHSAAVAAGVNFVSSARIVGVHHDGERVQGIELGGLDMDADRMDTQALAYPEPKPDHVDGARIPAETVLLAIDPAGAAELAGGGDFTSSWSAAKPVTAACLDIALRHLPQPKNTFALGVDKPLYYAVHSSVAQLAPKGGALIHLARYRKERSASNEELENDRRARSASARDDEAELEALLDRLQPGWRDALVHRRFLPAMTVSNALVTPDAKRPDPVTPVRGLYVAGDWVGNEGILSDAALASASSAAKAILAT